MLTQGRVQLKTVDAGAEGSSEHLISAGNLIKSHVSSAQPLRKRHKKVPNSLRGTVRLFHRRVDRENVEIGSGA